jgi:hypothetical protein
VGLDLFVRNFVRWIVAICLDLMFAAMLFLMCLLSALELTVIMLEHLNVNSAAVNLGTKQRRPRTLTSVPGSNL